ncbi:magnesium transporter [Ilyobacter polytropus]|uniref:Magnesium transporter MgtE n=1 Tax=Ilyobacter polytropus (strain ATCC 51220 / DSM 2926 / LMG 16218 / CuHBu1) TaxID=572544 RepID=E3H7U7_ILYPC|nr:magnesium transporter [Ilyobacter polytropus]ADO82899.1 magnesium transporter [Ilyobacter polytropus DSM 2926]
MRIGRDLNQLVDMLEAFLRNQREKRLHYSELSKIFIRLRKLDKEKFLEYIKRMPSKDLGDILLSLSENVLEEALEALSVKKLVSTIKRLESDDATDLLQDIEDIDEELAAEILEGLDYKEQEEIQLLKSYEEDQAGAYMQTEVFVASDSETVKETIERFRILKVNGELENVSSVFITGDYKNLVATISLEDIILFDLNNSFKELIIKSPEKYKPRYVRDVDDIEDVAKLFREYDLSAIPVVDDHGYLLGRITMDDIYDIVQEIATEQIYNFAGVDEDVETGKIVLNVSRNRGKWQFLNMCTAFFAASVIGRFQGTIEGLPALAVLMPIVASMGGNTGNQALTVMVRQLAVGDVDNSNWLQSLVKEILVAVMNGFIFAVLVASGSYMWFKNFKISIIMGIAILVNFAIAGLCGTMIPLFLKKMNTDPAVGSSILLTMITDALGFFIFLGMAKIFIY